MFAQSGFGKLQNLERSTEFFEGLGIPAPGGGKDGSGGKKDDKKDES